MARIRTIKPEFWRNRDLAGLPEFTRLLAIALLNLADDEGYFEADPRLVRGEVFPFEESSGRTTVGLRELSSVGYITVVTHPKKGDIGMVCNFHAHQVINKPTRSKLGHLYRESEYIESSRSPTVVLPEDYLLEGKGKEQGKEQGEGRESTLPESKHIKTKAFSEAWAAWKQKLLSNNGRRLDEWAEREQLAKLERYETENATELVLYCVGLTKCNNLIWDGSHKRQHANQQRSKVISTEELLGFKI